MPRWFVALLLAVALAPLAAQAGEKRPQRDPKELGRVGIVPFLDFSGERQEAKFEYRDTALSEVEERFGKYEIAFVSREEMQRAFDALKMSPNDEEDRTKARFRQLAEHLKVRYLVTGTIHEAESDVRRRGTFGRQAKAGQARVQFRVFDAESGRWAEDVELTATATARAGSPGPFSRSGKLRVKAVRDATRKSMTEFLKPYPKVHDALPDKE